MERDKLTHNPRIRFDQTYPGHKEYLLSLYDIFKNLVGTEPKIHIRKPDIRTKKNLSNNSLQIFKVFFF